MVQWIQPTTIAPSKEFKHAINEQVIVLTSGITISFMSDAVTPGLSLSATKKQLPSGSSVFGSMLQIPVASPFPFIPVAVVPSRFLPHLT